MKQQTYIREHQIFDVNKAGDSKPARSSRISHCSTNMQPEKTFRFLDLPPELGNLIYTLLFTAKPHKVFGYVDSHKMPGILLANKQIHKESIGLFWSNTTFQINYALFRWLPRLPTHRCNTIQRIRYACTPTQASHLSIKWYVLGRHMRELMVELRAGVV